MDNTLPNIIIVDDHDLFRDGLKTLLELNNVGKVVAEASNGNEFIALLKNYTPDIVLMDLEMPQMGGIDALKKAIQINPDIKVLVVSMFSDHQYYYDIVTAGAKGFILKTANKADLTQAIHSVIDGGTYFSSKLLQEMIICINKEKNNREKRDYIPLNDKEIEIISLMIEGLSAKEIANQTNLSPKTVSNYKTLLLEKTGCKNDVIMAVYARKHNLISI